MFLYLGVQHKICHLPRTTKNNKIVFFAAMSAFFSANLLEATVSEVALKHTRKLTHCVITSKNPTITLLIQSILIPL